MTEFKINFYMELDFKNLPDVAQKEFVEMFLELRDKRLNKKDAKMRIDVEEVKK